MAQLVEEVVVIKISKLVKDGEAVAEMLDAEMIDNIEAVLTEIVGDSKAMIEVIKASE
jgi:hypothetical protein